MDATYDTAGKELTSIESLFASSTAPRAGSTSWYDACDLCATELKARLRDRMGRGFQVEVHGDEVGLILRVRGDGYGVDPWSIDMTADPNVALAPQLEAVVDRVQERASKTYRGERATG